VANSAFTLDDLAKLHAGAEPKRDPSSLSGCSIPIINIPTSLSGGEYTFTGGATDFRTHNKASFQHPTIGASLVILDPSITVSTPEGVWLSSGMRAVDHCVEGLCSVFFSGPADAATKAKVEETLLAALQLLLPNLLVTKKQPRDLSTRRSCMLGVLEALRGLKAGVPMGASHGIGHQLGPLGVGHGETSCVMLPSVLRYNARHGEKWVREQQAKVLAAFWRDKTVADALGGRGHADGDDSLGDVVAAFVAALGLPGTLKDVGVKPEQFKNLAQTAMTDRYIPTNPVTITQAGQVEEILQMAAGN
jgi:alcohol dehydrogenase class IV